MRQDKTISPFLMQFVGSFIRHLHFVCVCLIRGCQNSLSHIFNVLWRPRVEEIFKIGKSHEKAKLFQPYTLDTFEYQSRPI